MGWGNASSDKLCRHKKNPKKCHECKQAKNQEKTDNSKMGRIRNAAKDMDTPWRADGSSKSGNRNAKGENMNGIRYDSKGKRIW